MVIDRSMGTQEGIRECEEPLDKTTNGKQEERVARISHSQLWATEGALL